MRRRCLTVLILLLVASSATVVCAKRKAGAGESGTISSTTELVFLHPYRSKATMANRFAV